MGNGKEEGDMVPHLRDMSPFGLEGDAERAINAIFGNHALHRIAF